MAPKICKDINKSFAISEKSKFWSSKNKLKPEEIFLNSSEKFIFNCDCGHEILQSPNAILNNRWCSYCSYPSQKLCDDLNCKNCFNKSFQSHEKSKFWSEKNNISPRNVLKGSGVKYIFLCKCNHEFLCQLDNVIKNFWCPYCSNRKLCDDLKCKNCFDNSFQSHEKSKFWSEKNILSPRQVFKGTQNKYIFECICGHTFYASLNSIISNSWCPYCSNHKLCDNLNCKKCFNKSFQSHEKSKYWSEKNILNPRQVFKGTQNKYIFNCNICKDEYISSITNIVNGRWCSCIRFKSEQKVFEFLKTKYNNIIRQKIILKNKKMDFTIIINNTNINIELDGVQHFIQIPNWNLLKDTKATDVLKMQECFKNNESVIRLYQPHVFDDSFNWKEYITESVNYIIENKVSSIFIHREASEIYKEHINDLSVDEYYEY